MARKKRILIFSLAYYPHVGGAEVAIKEITDRISDIEFHMLTLQFSGERREEKIGNVVVHRVGNSASYLSKILFIPRAAYAARALHRTHHFDAFWAMMSYMLFPIVLLRWIGIRTPYLLTLQEGDPFSHMFGRWFILPFRLLLTVGFKHASAIQTISAYLAGWARGMGYRGDIAVIPNGASLRAFSIPHTRPLSESDVVLVTTSRLVHKNAVDDVIRALAFLPETVRFCVYGVGKDEEELKHLAREKEVNARVEFKGQISHAELPRALAEADIFIRPSRSEGMGNSFIEAMAAGLPVIATQEGGIADFLYDAKRNPGKEPTGWAVDRDSPEQIAEAVKDIIAHPEKVATVTETAHTMVIKTYEWSHITRNMQDVFDRILLTR
jgi:glycosyltransferase involved in cell wall biosynthesis